MNEQFTNYEQFEMHLRSKKFTEAAKILATHCVGITETMIQEILATAYVSGTKLDFSQLSGLLSQRRRKVANAIKSLKAPQPLVTTKDQRSREASGKHRPS